ncbi:MAG: sulfur oxidation c-type cytochrome SoxA [Burkholderiaceae bacterium]
MKPVFFLLLLGLSGPLKAEIALAERRSGYDFMGAETRALQDDKTLNPTALSLLDGAALWGRKAGMSNKACADCHGDANKSMTGVATRYPRFHTRSGSLINLDQRINLCRSQQQQAPDLMLESKDLLALSAYLGRQSQGLPIDIVVNAKSQEFLDAGRASFQRRQGQLNFSCAQCHDSNWGKSLAGNTIPQAHPTGYPLYRLEWQALGSLQRRLRNCMTGMRAEPYDFGSSDIVALEYFLMWRARGMLMETPAVRP